MKKMEYWENWCDLSIFLCRVGAPLKIMWLIITIFKKKGGGGGGGGGYRVVWELRNFIYLFIYSILDLKTDQHFLNFLPSCETFTTTCRRKKAGLTCTRKRYNHTKTKYGRPPCVPLVVRFPLQRTTNPFGWRSHTL